MWATLFAVSILACAANLVPSSSPSATLPITPVSSVIGSSSLAPSLGQTLAPTLLPTLAPRVHCFLDGARYVDESITSPVPAAEFDAYLAAHGPITPPFGWGFACQDMCVLNVSCAKFTFYNDSNSCWLQTAAGVEETYAPKGNGKVQSDALAGPKICPTSTTAAPLQGSTLAPVTLAPATTTEAGSLGSSSGSSIDSISSSSPSGSSSSGPETILLLLIAAAVALCLALVLGAVMAMGGRKKGKRSKKSKKTERLPEGEPLMAPTVTEQVAAPMAPMQVVSTTVQPSYVEMAPTAMMAPTMAAPITAVGMAPQYQYPTAMAAPMPMAQGPYGY